jgi:hypothetical protein
MATVRGPLFSIGATGSIANGLTFQGNTRGTIAKRYARPRNPNTQAQRSIRVAVAWLAYHWRNMSPTDKQPWLELGEIDNVGGFAAFTRYNMDRWKTARVPSLVYPATELTTRDVSSLATALNGNILTATVNNLYPDPTPYHVALYYSPRPIATPDRRLCIGMFSFTTAARLVSATTPPLTAGDYAILCRTFSNDGKLGNLRSSGWITIS